MAEPGPSRQRQADLALIRAARPGEAAELTALALAAKAHWGYPASFMARCRAALTIEPAMIRRQVFRLAEGQDGIILGFYGFEPDPAGIGLSRLFVRPGAIGSGIGRALWQDAVALARREGYGRMMIVGDPHAAGFYRRMGAVPAGATPSEIDPGRLLPVFRLELG
ncbi:MAG TPA: GNAT family N-acetyltransferase [Verrucomicrobiae bacterium]|nr:GNAT family N-acetyltransferase [Verrucomicrobiae bacterium]